MATARSSSRRSTQAGISGASPHEARQPGVNILHVGWGFRPWRPGGLIAYAEDLMSAQVRRGHDVAYFLSGRHYPVGRPRLKRWHRGGVELYEAVNPPIVFGLDHGTRYPEHDLSDPWLEQAFDEVVSDRRPDVVHVQELAGLPSSLLERARAAGVPVLMTLHDYFPLCSTLRLYDSTGSVCLRRDIGEDCVATNAGAPADAGPLKVHTMHFELERAKAALPGVRRINFARATSPVGTVVGALARRGRPAPSAGSGGPPPTPIRPGLGAAYQRRRDVNLERLRRVDRLLTPSRRVAEIYRLLGVDTENLHHVPITLAHLERLRPRALAAPPRPVTFATLGGCSAPSKGVNVVLDALERLGPADAGSRWHLLVFGPVDPSAEAELARSPGVSVRGGFHNSELDRLLDEVDVGLVPSVWEETYGFVGLEFLAKGIPLLATPIGGVVEYAREGETAWLNHSRSGEGLAELMQAIVDRPERVVELHRSVVGLRDDLIIPIDAHAERMDEQYGLATS
jgi:glycosyltransferase involved in cell wall biosynthesis